MNLVRHELGFSTTESRFPAKGTCLAIYSRVRQCRDGRLEEVLRDVLPVVRRLGRRAARAVRRLCRGQAAPERARLRRPAALLGADGRPSRRSPPSIGGRFDHVLVDEYQDTNRLQASILLALKPDGAGPDRGRRRRPVDLFLPRRDGAQHPRLSRASSARRPTIVTLDRNYRSTQPILAAANAVIELAAERFTKNLWTDRASAERPQLVTVRDEADQARYVVEQRAGEPRGRHQPQAAGGAVPHLASQRAARGRADPAQHPLREVRRPQVPRCRARQGRAGAAAVRREPARPRRRLPRCCSCCPASARPRRSACSIACTTPPIRSALWPSRRPRRGPATTGRRFVDAIAQLARGRAPAGRRSSSWRGRWYEPHLERMHDDAATRKADLIQLEQIAAGYPSRERFLTELTLDPPDATSDQAGVPLLDEDYLILSTIHSAKGQEWKSVFVLNVVDGCIPSDLGTGTTAEIEEERRLLYVAMTRAKDHLHLVVPQRFFTHQQSATGDRHVYAARTRFIPSALLKLFERVSWPVAATDPATSHAATERSPRRHRRKDAGHVAVTPRCRR